MTTSNTPETDAVLARLVKNQAGNSCDAVVIHHARKLERERDEAREVFREMWQSGDAFLPHVDKATTNRWRKAAGWEETK